MPTPGTRAPIPDDFPASWLHPEAARAVRPRASDQEELVHQITELRKELQELRATLRPIPSFIATGQSVFDEFRRLNAKAQRGT